MCILGTLTARRPTFVLKHPIGTLSRSLVVNAKIVHPNKIWKADSAIERTDPMKDSVQSLLKFRFVLPFLGLVG